MSKRLTLLFALVWLVACGETLNPTPTTPTAPDTPSAGTVSGTITFSDASAIYEALESKAVTGFDQNAPIAPGEVIVQFEEGLRSQALQNLRVEGRTGEIQTLSRVRSLLLEATELYQVAGLSQAETYELVDRLEARPDVAHAMPNYLVQALREPTDPYAETQWNHQAMSLPAAWDETTGSPTVVVAVIDSGIVADHPDFGGRVLGGYDFVSKAAYAADGDGRDGNPDDPGYQGVFHGTHVAGIIGAATNNGLGVAGVDWNTRILPVRALGPQTGEIADVLDAALWAAGLEPDPFANPHPADVLNFSLGSVTATPCSAIEQQVYDRIIAAGKIVIAAAGNTTSNAAYYTPGNCPNVITVGAISRKGERAYYSNYGSRLDVMAPGGEQKDTNASTTVTAEDGVLSLNASGDYVYLQGTSMAAPHVAGLAALMKALEPNATQGDVRAALVSTARPLSTLQCDAAEPRVVLSSSDCGAGAVDAAAALAALTVSTVDLAGTQVFACSAVVNNTCRIAQQITVTGRGNTVRYSFSGLPAGRYVIVAWKDVNRNGYQDTGDIEGTYKNAAFVTSPATNINFTVTQSSSRPSALRVGGEYVVE
jgi:serine protease